MHQMVPLFYYIFMHEFSLVGGLEKRPLDLEVSVSYTPGSTNIAGWKMDPDWADVFPIEHGDIPASYVSLQECRKCNS